jgi:signal peptide peptidase SppA
MMYSRILAAIAAQPWAMQKEKLTAMLDVVRLRSMGITRSHDEISAAINPQRANAVAKREGNVAMIPVYGIVSQRMDMLSEFSGGISTERLMADMKAALADNTVKAIVMDVDSPGGGVYGVQEVSDFIRSSRGEKPIIAQINSLAASGGYWIGSAADEIVITPGGEAGSIGVYMLHSDFSKFLDEAGIKETFIFAGKNKVEGNSSEPLGDDALAYFQSRVDDYYEMFVDAVAKGRGITVKKVNQEYGQGRVFGAKQAVAVGMADRIATLDQTLARYGVSRTPGKSRALRERELKTAETI